jgi:superfamily II DNA or RNA helicase
MTTQLYTHQQIAIDTVVDNKFASGVIQYATGSGKSIIGFNIVNKYHEMHPDKYVFWICEHKFILKEHFTNNKHINKSMIINYSDDIKPADWPSLVNQTKIWRKPTLVVVNRAFLTMNKKYELLKIPIGLVIHDECHSISSETTREFYAWLPADCKKIGLSATPLYCYEPFTRKICEFTIVDAIKNNIVAKPLIVCAKSEQQITMDDKLGIIHNYLHEHSVHKKMIIWCGTIKHTNEILEIWRRLYSNEFACYISHSGIKNNDDVLFNEADNNAILFCACGHHEASDFRNLDGCALLDGVKIRTDKLFVQCLGRVIRKAPNKIYGWILDFDAKNTKQLCDMLMSFVTKSNWRFVQTTHNKDHIELHCISIELDADIIQKPPIADANELCMQHFIRPCPNTANYMHRLHQEMTMINRKNLANYLLKATQIRDLCQDRIFITRGSCGSSLVCYLLGLTHVDPVKYNVNFARFLHEGRSGLPDIDFDFAYNIRDDVFVKINTHFDNVARISCDVKWCERSATREAIRRIGFNKQMDNRELSILLRSLSNYQKTMVEQIKKSLIGQKRTTMLHVGGIIFDQTTNLNDKKK